ncbi:hypothetical protein [Silvimonas iriomotensis]|uniref:Aldose 1-epimerase n=1 Tax=Silvimonas iriomotensis TaxID=449662 RepID=A0ABQ2P431_9NEIS|nr:hypothetical protein [Silvimonas iriomotensis]GGP17908.1 hypothetical protein GCM10010970_02170 [Silvimonas iriomotensis]
MQRDDATSCLLVWEHGTACIEKPGAMLGPVYFRLSAQQDFQPFYVAPWPDDPALPGLLRAMRGEWPCVPFSRTETPQEIAPGWRKHLPADAAYADIHGPGANHPWQVLERDALGITLGIEYPRDSAIALLRREIRADPHAPALDISLTIYPRRDTVMPVALHPTFRLPRSEGGLLLQPGAFEQALTFPTDFEASSRLAPGASAHHLAALPGKDGQPVDLSALPLASAQEELLQLVNAAGRFDLVYRKEQARVRLTWDAAALPDVVLWISNGGRPQAPWLGRNFALGVEPVNGVFELGGVLQPPPDHPLARRGLVLQAGVARTIHYRISVENTAAAPC